MPPTKAERIGIWTGLVPIIVLPLGVAACRAVGHILPTSLFSLLAASYWGLILWRAWPIVRA